MSNILLTSAGFDNKKIEEKFLELVDKAADEIKAIFIPTAAVTEEQKAIVPFCEKDLLNAGVLKDNIYHYDLDQMMLDDELDKYDAIYVCGGDTQHLLNRINEVDFNISLKRFIDNGGVYVGVSAGSIIFADNLKNNLGYMKCKLNVHTSEGEQVGDIDVNSSGIISLTDNQAIVMTNHRTYIIE